MCIYPPSQEEGLLDFHLKYNVWILPYKVGGFGMSRDLADAEYYISHGGKIPVRWTSPEAMYYRKYSTASDVWSYGCLLYEIWSLGRMPFKSFTNAQVATAIRTVQVMCIVKTISASNLRLLKRLTQATVSPLRLGAPGWSMKSWSTAGEVATTTIDKNVHWSAFFQHVGTLIRPLVQTSGTSYCACWKMKKKFCRSQSVMLLPTNKRLSWDQPWQPGNTCTPSYSRDTLSGTPPLPLPAPATVM